MSDKIRGCGRASETEIFQPEEEDKKNQSGLSKILLYFPNILSPSLA